MVGNALVDEAVHFQPRRVSAAFEALCINPIKSDHKAAAALVMDRTNISRAMSWITEAGTGQIVRPVYVITAIEHGVSKIGYSDDPKRRLRTLQCNVWCEVEIAALFWSLQHPATLIEAWALSLAADRGVRLKGEWVDLPADETVGLILESIDPLHLFADSGTFMDNWAPQLNETFVPA